MAAVGGAAALWAGGAAVASRLFDRGVAPLELVEARALIAAVGLGLITIAGRVTTQSVERAGADSSRGGKGINLATVALGLALGLVNLAYYLAIDRLAVAVAIVLQYSAPALVVAWGALVGRQRPSGAVIGALLGALTGVVLVSEVLTGELGSVDLFGIAMGFASAALFASYTLLSEPVSNRFGPLGAVFRAFTIASIFWVLVQVPRGWPHDLFDPRNIGLVLFVGLAGTLVPFLLYVWGVSRVRAERASIAATLEPVLAALFAWMWLDQSLSAMQIAGGVLVIISIGALQRR